MSLRAVIFDVGNTLLCEHENWQEIERKGVTRLVETLRSLGVELEESSFADIILNIRQANFDRARKSEKEITAYESLQEALKAADIKEITVYCKDKEYFLLHPLEKRSRPENPVDSQFSIPWAVAAVFARGRAGIGEFTEEAIESQDILNITDKIRVEEDAELQKEGTDAAKIGVTTRQGQTYVEKTGAPESSSGQQPFGVYERKFRDCAAYSIKRLTDKQADEVIDCVKRLEQIDDVSELIKLLS